MRHSASSLTECQLWDKLLQAFNHYVTLDKEKGYIYIIPLLWYTSTKVPAEQQGELNKIIQNYLSTTGEDNIMRSIAQKYLDEGKAEEKAVIAKNLLKSGINIELVAKSTGLTIKEIELINDS